MRKQTGARYLHKCRIRKDVSYNGIVKLAMDTNKLFRIHGITDESVSVDTSKGSYTLKAHDTIENLSTGVTPKGIKIHFTKKKIVGKLIYWS